ncbi:MAG: class II aldolase/adducin family protein [Acidobacteriia bacterium]|nr:class II aldolase/adducin family protein [Terriglobia bacterium]
MGPKSFEFQTENEAARAIVEIGRRVWQKGFVAANDGNISVRMNDREVMATPSSRSKGFMEADEIVKVDLRGNKISGKGKPSTELPMHLLIYELRPDVQAVVHCHPPVATGFAAAGLALDRALISEIILSLGCVPLAAYGTPATADITKPLAPLIPHYDAILMANHGVVCFGPTLDNAYFKMETVEHFARINLVAKILGRENLLSREEVDKLFARRGSVYGIQSPTQFVPGCPVVADAGVASTPGDSSIITVTKSELIDLIQQVLEKRY